MPPGQMLLGGVGLPVVALSIGLAQGGYMGGHKHVLAAPIIAGIVAIGFVVMFFGRTTVLKPEGIAYGYFFFATRPIAWARITDVTADSKVPLKAGRLSWQVTIHLDGGGAVRLPAPYAVGSEPSAAFRAEYEAIHQRWHQEKAHTKSPTRRGRRRSAR